MLNLANLDTKNKELENSVCYWKCKYLSNEKDFTELQLERTNLKRNREENEDKIDVLSSKISSFEQEKYILLGRQSSYEKEIKNLHAEIHHLRS